MNRPRDELLADAALAANEHGHIVVGDAIDDGRDRPHDVAVGPEGERLIVVDALAQLGDFRHELPLLDGLLDGRLERDFAQSVRIVGLDDVVHGAVTERFDDRLRVLAARKHDHLQIRVRRLQAAQRRDAVHARHHHVEQDDVREFPQPGGRE